MLKKDCRKGNWRKFSWWENRYPKKSEEEKINKT